MLEAIQFFVTAVQFGVSAAQIGVRRMIVLVWSQEQSVKEALVEAYRLLYLGDSEKNQRCVEIVSERFLNRCMFCAPVVIEPNNMITLRQHVKISN